MRIRWGVGALVGITLLLPAWSHAALLHEDTAAMLVWKGTQTFQGSGIGYVLKVDVDYAVYAPGTYPGLDPSAGPGPDYVYAYEIFNTIYAPSPAVSSLTVGLVPNSTARHIGTDTSAGAPGKAGGVAPGAAQLTDSSAVWTFLADRIDYGEDSVTLIFTSPNGPHWMTASVIDGGTAASADLPSPIPEPPTLVLLALGGLALIRRRRRAGP